jgi:septum formation protein
VSFKVIPSGADEKTNLMKPSHIVKELAYRKGRHVAQSHPDALILSADTVVVLNGKIIGKPKSKEESKKIIKELNGSSHKIYTGVAVIQKDKRSVFYDVACIKMRKLPENMLRELFGKHIDKAGAYAVQDPGDYFVEKIYGDYYTAVGLPYKKLAAELKKFRIKLKSTHPLINYNLSKTQRF